MYPEIIATESDEHQVKERADRLAATVNEARLIPRATDERIVLWIPRRNIETWLLHLSGEPVTEESDDKLRDKYRSRWENKRKARNADYESVAAGFVERFRRWNRREAIPDLLPSLEAAFQETRDRLPFA